MSAANYHQFFHGSIGCWSGQDTGHTIYVKVPLEKNGCNLGLCATLMSRVLNCFHWWSQVYACIISYPKWICQAYFHNISVCPKRATPFAGVWGPKKKKKDARLLPRWFRPTLGLQEAKKVTKLHHAQWKRQRSFTGALPDCMPASQHHVSSNVRPPRHQFTSIRQINQSSKNRLVSTTMNYTQGQNVKQQLIFSGLTSLL